MDLAKNAYLIEEEKPSPRYRMEPYSSEFIDNLESEIDLNKIDFIVCNHGEVDHSGSPPALMEKSLIRRFCKEMPLSPRLVNIIIQNGILKL